MKVKVGVFWLCNFDIIYDSQEIEINENSIDLIVYEKQHKDVWNSLSQNQFNGKYAIYSYDFFPRGRVCYDSYSKKYSIILNDSRKVLPQAMLESICNIFGLK